MQDSLGSRTQLIIGLCLATLKIEIQILIVDSDTLAIVHQTSINTPQTVNEFSYVFGTVQKKWNSSTFLLS